MLWDPPLWISCWWIYSIIDLYDWIDTVFTPTHHHPCINQQFLYLYQTKCSCSCPKTYFCQLWMYCMHGAECSFRHFSLYRGKKSLCRRMSVKLKMNWQKMQLSFSFFWRTCIYFLLCSLQGANKHRLYYSLMRDYNRLFRPVINDSHSLTVQFGVSLMQIIDVVRIKCPT